MIDYEFGVALGALNSTHVEQARTWRNKPEIMRWCRQVDVISDMSQTRWFESQDSDPSLKMYSIFFRATLVGVCGFTSITRPADHAEFSLYISPEHHKQGLGMKALKTLFQHGFMSLGLRQIWGETLEGNPALSLFKKLGMREDGVRRDFYFKDGALFDATLISITRDEWETAPWRQL